jgi:hypothetical protein
MDNDAKWLGHLRLADTVIADQEEARLAVALAATGMPVEAMREIDWLEVD